jgi:NADH-quinone oxidoreductase subunit E
MSPRTNTAPVTATVPDTGTDTGTDSSKDSATAAALTTTVVKSDLAGPVREIVARYPQARSAIMPALYLAQEKYGHVDGTVYKAISELLDVPEIWVFEVASFYTMFAREPRGTFHIQLCDNLSCMLLGADHMRACLEHRLGIQAGQTSKDGMFTLSLVECIGSCDVAPAMMINQDQYSNLDEAKLTDILDQLTLGSAASLSDQGGTGGTGGTGNEGEMP